MSSLDDLRERFRRRNAEAAPERQPSPVPPSHDPDHDSAWGSIECVHWKESNINSWMHESRFWPIVDVPNTMGTPGDVVMMDVVAAVVIVKKHGFLPVIDLMVNVGKYQGKTMSKIRDSGASGYLRWMYTEGHGKDGGPDHPVNAVIRFVLQESDTEIRAKHGQGAA